MARAQHARVDAEAHILRLLALARVGADAHRQHEVMYKHAGGALVLARVSRIAARREQAIVDFRRLGGLMRKLLNIARNQSADFVDGGMTRVSRAQAAAAEDIRREQQEARDVGRLECTRKSAEDALRTCPLDESSEHRNIHDVEE